MNKVGLWSPTGNRMRWSAPFRARGEEDASCPIVIASLAGDPLSIRRFLESHRRRWPTGVVVGVAATASQARAFLGPNEVDVFVVATASDADLDRCVARAERLWAERERRQTLFNQAKDHNRQLERLTEDLEGVVEERTKAEEDSKSQVENRVAELRELLRFMQDLASATSPEEVIQILRREWKVHHGVREPVLAYTLGSGERRLVYFRSGQILERRATQAWPQSLRLRRHDPLDSQYLANEFGRPFARVLAVPLIVRKHVGDHLQPTLFLEHQLKSHALDQFVDFIGDRLQIVSVALDRLLLEYDLRSATYLWEHTFDGFEDPVAIVDLDRRVMRANRAFNDRHGKGECFKQFAGRSEPCVGCPLAQAVGVGRSGRAVVPRGGEMFAVHTYPIRLAATEPVTAVVNHYVNVTQDLALQEQMVQTEKMAALGHLAGHIAHELNNPLTGIRSLAQFWLHQVGEEGTIKSDLGEVEKAAERSQGIIANLLQFARGSEPGRIRDVDLGEVVQRTLPFLKTAVSRHNLHLDIPDAPALVRAEASMVQQVVFNLVKNACQAMAERGDLHIGLELRRDPPATYWDLVIRDTGVGIAPEHLANLFTPFFTTKSEGEGTGLGLSLSRTLIRRFGGDIQVTSTPGQGAEFRVSIPAKEGQ